LERVDQSIVVLEGGDERLHLCGEMGHVWVGVLEMTGEGGEMVWESGGVEVSEGVEEG